MDLFFTENWDQQTAILTGDEARHCARVFRHGPGESILLTDGKGHRITAVIESISKNEVLCRTEKVEDVGSGRKYKLDLLIAPTKNLQRMEWLLEKSVEIGLDRIFFMKCFHSERKKIRVDRLERIALAAMKQSRQYILPEIHDIHPFQEMVEKTELSQQYKLVAHLSESSQKVNELLSPKGHYSFMIGPEGDFSEEEIGLALQNDWKICSLGDQRLRTETAALTAVNFASFINMDN